MNSYRMVGEAGKAELGEGPIWSAARDSLFWVDILGHRLHRLGLGDGRTEA